jgi:AcrR family transcriptional regulator
MGKNKDAPTRIALLDATERVLSQDGYGAVVARRVAAEASVNQQIVYYYFENMEELVCATFRRRVEEFLEGLERVLEAENPLRGLWGLLNDGSARLFAEFIAMANHSDVLRADLQRYSAKSNELQTQALQRVLSGKIDFEFCPPEVINYILISVTRNLAVEKELGTVQGDDLLGAFVDRCLALVEPEPAARSSTRPRRGESAATG